MHSCDSMVFSVSPDLIIDEEKEVPYQAKTSKASDKKNTDRYNNGTCSIRLINIFELVE